MLNFFNRALDDLEWGYVLGLAFPAVLLLVALKCARLAGGDASPGVWGGADLLKSEIFFGVGLGLGGVSLLHLVERTWIRRLVLCALQLIFLFVLIIEVSGHNFAMATGSSLDYYVMAFSLENLADTADVISSEVPTSFVVLASTTILWVVAMPWLVCWAAGRVRTAQKSRGGRILPPMALPVAAAAFIAAAALPAVLTDANVDARVSTINVAMSASKALQEAVEEPEHYESTARETTLEEQSENPGEKPRNLAFILLESTRARSTSVYNRELETTPFLEELADESTVGERAYAVVPHTSKALVASLCGIEPRLNMPITESAPGNIPANCLARLLAEQDYRTGFFQSAVESFEGRRQLVENMGYETFIPVDEMDKEGFAKANYFGREDDIMLEPTKKWLEADDDRPFFATYLTLTPHHNYLAPRRYGRHDFAADDDELNHYLNSVHYVDQFVKNVFEQYKELGVYEDTIFVIVGDHGEGFGEHGRRQHDNVIYEEGLRVPLLIHDPQERTPRRIEHAVSQIDLLPTLASWLGFEITGGDYPGDDIREVDPERPIRAHCWYERRCMAQIVGDQKYIHHFDSRADEFFDLGDDPLEQENLAAGRDDLGQWRRELHTWRDRINAIYRHHAEESLDKFIFEEAPDIEHQLDAQFGDEVRLLGYDLSDDTVDPGGNFTITYYFESLAPLDEGWKLFVHGDGSEGVDIFDHVPVSGLYPVHEWQPGQIIADTHDITVPGGQAPGDFEVYVGIWHPKKGRKAVSGRIETDGKDRARVTTLRVRNK
ncbi:MAG: LTA synthase family protein [Persicimonas sp.]